MTVQLHPGDAKSWRDLADRLPAHLVRQYVRLERFSEAEIRAAFPGDDPAEIMQRQQQHMLDEALEQLPFEHVALPATATNAETWQDDGTGTWTRMVIGTYRQLDHLAVGIDGIQSADGSVRWSMYVNADDDATTPDQALAFSALLLAASDELEALR
jgi:hypothetical protein